MTPDIYKVDVYSTLENLDIGEAFKEVLSNRPDMMWALKSVQVFEKRDLSLYTIIFQAVGANNV